MSEKRQRDPRAFLGQERLLLHWISLMAWVVSTSFAFSMSRSQAAQVLQYAWLPFAASGVLYSAWRYYARIAAMTNRTRRVDVRLVVDVWGPYFIVALFCLVLASLWLVRLFGL